MTASNGQSTGESQAAGTPIIPRCPRCAPLEGDGPGLGANPVAAGRAWLRVGIAAVVAGQTMLFGFGYSVAPENFGVSQNLQPGTAAYWTLHGLLITGACIVMGLCGWPLLKTSFRQLQEKRLTVDMLFLASVVGAFIGSLTSSITGEREVYYDVVSLVLAIYTLGKLLGERSREKAVSAAEGLRKEFGEATVLEPDGSKKSIPVEAVEKNMRVLVGAGEPITVDGVIVEGESFIQEATLTGEPAAVPHKQGDAVLAGTWALDGRLVIQTSGRAGKRMLDEVLEAVAGAQIRPSRLQLQADAVARWFLPVVATVALLTFIGWLSAGAPWTQALLYSMSVLLVACPCALGLATPMAVWGGLWTLARMGLVARSGDFIDTLADTRRFVFDKTGTLSDGKLHIKEVQPLGKWVNSKTELLSLIAAAERDTTHPMARALKELAPAERYATLEARTVAGRGLVSRVKNRDTNIITEVGLGELALHTDTAQVAFQTQQAVGSAAGKVLYISVEQEPAGIVYLEETFRPGLKELLTELEAAGISSVILTGDKQPPAILSELNIQVQAGLLPEAKLQAVSAMIKASEEPVFVGDGINDASAMAACPASIAMGGGTALARSTATAVIMGESLRYLGQAVKVCRNIKQTVGKNLLFAAVYNFVGMGLAAAGLLHPVLAALLMLASSTIVSIRAIRSTEGGKMDIKRL